MTDLVPVEEAQSLTADPVQYMAIALNRAKHWLSEAQSIEEVRDTRAIAVGYESVIREKELAFDAQLSATEIVRRCERRIGELVREGQREGTIRTQGEGGGPPELVQRNAQVSPYDAVGVTHNSKSTVAAHYALADVPAAEFEQAVTKAREEGNLSRANVVRKVKGEQPKTTDRSEWHHKTRRINSERILLALTQELDAAASGLELMNRDELDADLVTECTTSINASISTIKHHVRRIQ